MDKIVSDTMRATGCTESIVNSLFRYFNERCGRDVQSVLSDASYKFNLSPITVVNAFRFWKLMG